MFVVVALAACGSKKQSDPESTPEPDPHEPKRAEPVAAADAAEPADAAIRVDGVPKQIAPLEPFDQLQPQMKEVDAKAKLTELRVKKVQPQAKLGTFDSDGADHYETRLPGVVATLSFYDGRLSFITFKAATAAALVEPVFARWGRGTENDRVFYVAHGWPASSGWQANMEAPPTTKKDYIKVNEHAVLTLHAIADPAGQQTLEVDGKVFSQLSGLIGAKLATAEKGLGPALRRETSDDDDEALERGTARQGYAQVKVPWSENVWTLVVRTNPRELITSIVLSGEPSSEEGRIALFTALKTAFGPPRAVVSPAGRVEVELGSGVIAHVAESGEQIEITISR